MFTASGTADAPIEIRPLVSVDEAVTFSPALAVFDIGATSSTLQIQGGCVLNGVLLKNSASLSVLFLAGPKSLTSIIAWQVFSTDRRYDGLVISDLSVVIAGSVFVSPSTIEVSTTAGKNAFVDFMRPLNFRFPSLPFQVKCQKLSKSV